MSDQNKARYDKSRRELSLTSMYFNRYLLIRYVTAGFFFANLYWLFLSLGTQGAMKWVPFCLTVINAVVAVEQVSKYWRRDSKLPFTKFGYVVQLISNFLSLSIIVAGSGTKLFPFLGQKGLSLATTVLLIGLGICFYLLVRIRLIEKNQDRYLQQINKFAQSIQ
ncbi:hypothetical protein FAM18132_01649 [Lacticaseibacillus paracasei]|jgi:hypothetical protein|uniref:PTS cellobiose transporter subunit IIC n=1 Tax=Lacticaseibacillus paracasei TaxID=1597 RepID=UPI000F0B35DB|nr:PTS cellobiose transporter subunit IIC [Lacticaseibacillus paracasei]MCI1940239.1 PTS cellobiose transporter subunit IIC [Lacticaseibacillus paracasei]RND39627.1 hypothetical protein FAM18101_01835 [Lacticaseibacillus paracasei]RND44819.1 hypothetical protein FAM18105_01648 [Lacticaseibacillus paracasei]RND71818.1 hypothetical protein FAM18132_01649 [Lacticaseibacillus paracasei]